MKTPKFTTSINVRFPPGIKEELTTFANERTRSEADVIREAVYEYLNKYRVTSTFDVATPDRNMEGMSIVVSQLKEILERLNSHES